MGNENMICDICGKEFTSKLANFRRHLKNKHNIIENVKYNMKCMEPMCNFNCFMLKDLRHHLETKHKILQEVEELQFKNIEEFNKWKIAEENRCVTVWVKHTGNTKQKDAAVYYYCNRSGKKRVLAADQRKRMMKSQGSCKIDFACTSAIVMKNVSEGIKIKYYKNHYGHDNKMAHVHLSTDAKNMIASQLIQGVPPTEILNKIRESVDMDFERIHLTTKKDIHNIVQEYNLYDTAVKNPNDAVSIDMWVTQVQHNENDNSVILYKKQGEECSELSLNKEDFLLGIMTKCQVEMLKKFGTGGIVCMDATHGTNPYDFNLISILVVDDFGEGFPVGFLFTNREDYVVLKYFIAAIKDIVGDIEAATFMSDDAEQYFAAWSSVMNVTETKKLLCMWHVDRAWRSKINSIKNKTKQAEVYKMLCVLRQEPDAKKFEDFLKSFRVLLSSDPELTAFATYFRENYEIRCSVWATCYRTGSAINTNMFLESMHKVLKYIYLKGVTCRRLDKTVHVLLRYVRDKQFQRVIKLDKGKVTNKISRINRSHITAANAKNMKTIKVESGWQVQSDDKNYDIKQNNVEKNHLCNLKCSACSSCVHFYSCTCMDFIIHNNMCKHIHKICISNSSDRSKEPLKNHEEKIDEEELHQHLNILKNPNINEIKDKIRKNINSIVTSDWNNITDQVTLNKINHSLISTLNLIKCDQGSSFTQGGVVPKPHPVNKKIEGQLRFRSTKRKRVAASRLTKPSLEETKSITSKFEEVDGRERFI